VQTTVSILTAQSTKTFCRHNLHQAHRAPRHCCVSTPLEEATMPCRRGSISVAARSARAKACKEGKIQFHAQMEADCVVARPQQGRHVADIQTDMLQESDEYLERQSADKQAEAAGNKRNCINKP